jgi:hypothetical protein
MNRLGDTILDYVFNSFILKFGKREIYDENIYSDLHKEFITTLVNLYRYRYLANSEDPTLDSVNTNLIEFTELENSDSDDDKYKHKKFNYDDVETLALHLSLQLQLLEKRGFTMLYLQSADIIRVRVNECKKGRDFCMYLLVDLTQLVPLDKQDHTKLVLNYPKVFPFPKSVCAPELYTIGMLPFITHRSASYYSVGLLCLHLLNYQNQNLSLTNLRDTPLFYFLERCLKEEPLERMCLFI